jgi:glycosyltransferase involved in cell wall biosynthesis
MKVLVVHNEYRAALPSGENLVVRRQIDDLRAIGVDVIPYLRSSDELARAGRGGRLRAAASAVGVGDAIGDLRRVLQRERPDIVHLHNLFPLISARVVGLAQEHDAKVVQTVHNFRHVCIAGTYFRDGHECFDCRGHRFGRPGVKHACYRGSKSESLVMATAIAAYRPQLRGIDAAIALAPHLRQHCIDYGFPAERVEVIPNTATDPGDPTPLGSGLLFASRFSPEKGLALLADAWSRLPPHAAGRLTIVGDGVERPVAVALAAARPDVDYLGRVEPHEIPALLQATAAVVVPSRWQEVCPTIVVDALAHGRPVLATDRGGLPYLVGSNGGWLVSPSPGALADGIRRAVAGAPSMAVGARQRFLDAMAPDVVLTRTTDLYERLRAG